MIRNPLRRRAGWTLVALSLALHAITVFCFARHPDRFAAFTVVPIWLWGGIGLTLSASAFYFLRASLSMIVTSMWALTILLGADEARVLANLGKQGPAPGPAAPFHGAPVVRVATLNCSSFEYGDPSFDIAAWQPDIILLQEAEPQHVRRVADVLYDGHGDYRTYHTNGIVTRWMIRREVRNPFYRDHQATIRTPEGREIEVVNIHINSASTNLELWTRSCWVEHRLNLQYRRQELSTCLQVLEQTSPFPSRPTLLGGDFNSPANDVVHDLLARDFTDAFAAVGTGWGDTFQRRIPILRIDCLYATRQFRPVRCHAVTTNHSDHRMVIADYVLHED